MEPGHFLYYDALYEAIAAAAALRGAIKHHYVWITGEMAGSRRERLCNYEICASLVPRQIHDHREPELYA